SDQAAADVRGRHAGSLQAPPRVLWGRPLEDLVARQRPPVVPVRAKGEARLAPTLPSMTKHVAVIPGDLAGQEVSPEAVRVVDALGLGYEFEEFEVGAAPLLRGGPAMSEQTFQEASGADAILFGAIGDPRVPDVGYAAQVLFKLRFGLDLYVNLRPARLYDDRLSPLRDPSRRGIDLTIVRENTEGAYVGMGARFKRGTAQEVAVQEE